MLRKTYLNYNLLLLALAVCFTLTTTHSYADLPTSRYGKTKFCKKLHLAPNNLHNKKMILQIESNSLQTPDTYPEKGLLVQSYDIKSLEYEGFGNTLSAGTADYKYRKIGYRLAKERYFDHVLGSLISTQYTFDSPNSGIWKRSLGNIEAAITGRFFLENSSEKQEFAPTSHNNVTISLSVLEAESELPPGSFPANGSVILQSYEPNNIYSAQGFGPGTVSHFGEYEYTKISANVALEQTLQTIPDIGFTAPFTMIYHYESPYSGTWYQNFANGLITFSGYFTAFPSSL